VTGDDETGPCANCRRVRPATDLDAFGWCSDCRKEVVRRATLIAHLLGGLAGVAVGLWIIMVVQPGPRFMLAWLVLVGLTYFILYKLARRVSFEVIRSRGVPPPAEE
jgi:hypothetical protein